MLTEPPATPEVTTQEFTILEAISDATTIPPGGFSATTVGGALGGAIVGLVVMLGVVIIAVLLLKKHRQLQKGREGRSQESSEIHALQEIGLYPILFSSYFLILGSYFFFHLNS